MYCRYQDNLVLCYCGTVLLLLKTKPTQSHLVNHKKHIALLAKNVGTNSKTQHEIPAAPPPPPPAPMQCCQVAVFMYNPIDFSGFQHCLGDGGLPKFAMTAPPSLRRLTIDIQNTNVHYKGYFRICPREFWPG